MNQYTIGQMAKALGVSPQTLRHYEALGLFTSARDDNCYRMYSTDDMRLLFQTAIYRSMGFSLGEIGKMLKEDTTEQVLGQFERRLSAVQAEIETLLEQQRELKEYQESIRFCREHIGECVIEQEGHVCYIVLKQGDGTSIPSKEDTQLLRFQKKVPNVRQAFRLTVENIRDDKVPFSYQYGVALLREWVWRNCEAGEMDPYLVKMEPPVAHTVLEVGEEKLSRWHFARFLDEVERLGYRPAGDLYGVARFVSYREGEKNLFEFKVPVRRAETG